MDDPVAEIRAAINACAGAASPDAQMRAIEQHFTRDARFLHPLCHVRAGPDSRRRIMAVYLFYRAVIARTSFEVQSVAFDAEAKQLFVRLVQRPAARGIGRFFVPEVPMLIHLVLRREGGSGDGKWLIESQEDLVQIRSCFMAVPVLRWVGLVIYFIFEMGALTMAYLLTSAGIWRPIKERDKVF